MKKFVVLAAIAFLFVGIGAAADRHGPQKTGKFVVEFEDDKVAGWKTVTIPAVAVEQGTYREGNDADYEKKTWGQPTFDNPEMERGVKPGDIKLHEDVRAGSADAARKEISVKIQNEEGDRGPIAVKVEKKNGKDITVNWYYEEDDEDMKEAGERSARNGRNPQTGKEIKIPARSNHRAGNGETIEVPLYEYDGDNTPIIKGSVIALAEKESGEEYFVHVSGLIDDIQEDDKVAIGQAIEYLEENTQESVLVRDPDDSDPNTP